AERRLSRARRHGLAVRRAAGAFPGAGDRERRSAWQRERRRAGLRQLGPARSRRGPRRAHGRAAVRARAAFAACALCAAIARPSAAQSADGAREVEISVRALPRKHDALEQQLDAEQARRAAGSENDPLRAVENLPGVARPSFGSGELIVWGSPASDTRTLV